VRRLLRENGLSIAMFGLFAVFLGAQSLTGWHSFNSDEVEHGGRVVGYASYLTTGHFMEGVFENWESEFLQMASYIVLTIWLVQKGSAESKPLEGDEERDRDPRLDRDKEGVPGPVRRGGWRLKTYENSLSIAFGVLFILSIVLHAFGGARDYNAQQIEHGQPVVSVGQFVKSSTFWYQSFQNWQSEFLAVGLFVVLTVFLRQRGSPQSKPVAAPHDQTGS
jgi:uncharacterized protein (DUF486 family)